MSEFKKNSTQKGLIQFGLLALDQSEAECFSEAFAVPLWLAECIEPGCTFISAEKAIEANQILAEVGHSPEIRKLIDRLIRRRDIEALKSLHHSSNTRVVNDQKAKCI